MATIATSPQADAKKALVLLSLDGGGIRGLSELCILEVIMHRVKRAGKLDHDPLPADYFDMIGGTSTGGLVALLLGRLRLSVPEAKVIFARMSKEIFSQQKPKWRVERFMATNLENSVKAVLREQKFDQEARLLVEDDNPCRTFVCAVPGRTVSAPRLFRTYETNSPNYNPKIWEAGRATSAAPTFFKSIEMGSPVKELFVDGGLGCNNPSEFLIKEAMREFEIQSDRKVACIVSIGTGQRNTIELKAASGVQKMLELAKTLKQIATETEKVASALETRFRNCPGLYSRLNVDRGLESVELAAWEDLDSVETNTKAYLEGHEVDKTINLIVDALLGKAAKTYPLGHLDGTFHPQLQPLQLQPLQAKCLSSLPNFRAAHFVSRYVMLQLEKQFELPNTSHGPQVVVLYGMGGCGKSQLALDYCNKVLNGKEPDDNESNDKGYAAVLWVDAGSPETLKQSFGKFAQMMGKLDFQSADGEGNVQYVREQLQIKKQKWLLVYDNYDEPASFKDKGIKEYFPQGKEGSIIVTTRHLDARSLGFDLDASKMTLEEAVKLLLRRSKIVQNGDNSAKAEPVVKRLGFHALAIDQAGAYIRSREILDISLYLEVFEKQRGKVLEEVPIEWDYAKRLKEDPTVETNLTVFTTWELSFAYISGDRVSRDDKEQLLTLMAFLDHTEISDKLFNAYGRLGDLAWMPSCRDEGAWESDALQTILREMYSLSLLQSFQVLSEEAIFSIHPLVQDWLKLRQSKEKTSAASRQAILIVGKSAYIVIAAGSKVGERSISFQERQKLLAHINAMFHILLEFITPNEMQNTANLLDAMRSIARFLSDEGSIKPAADLQRLVVERRKDIFGIENPKTITSMYDLAAYLKRAGDYGEAETLCRDVIGLQKHLLGVTHTETLWSQSLLANILLFRGKYVDAERWYSETLALQKQTLGDKHPDTIASQNGLASALWRQGKFDKAEPLRRACLAASLEVFGKEHVTSLNYMSDLAFLLGEQGKHDEAEPISRETLELSQKVQGQEHPDTLTSMNNLATLLQDQGKYDEAELIYRQNLKLQQKMLGQEHPNTLTSIINLAYSLEAEGKFNDAELLYRESLSLSSSSLGNVSLATLTLKHALACLLTEQERLVEAESLFHSACSELEPAFGIQNPETIDFLLNFAISLSNAGKDKEAEEKRQLHRSLLAKLEED